MTDLETAARDYAREVIGQFDRNGVVPAFSAYNGFLAGAAHMQKRIEELERENKVLSERFVSKTEFDDLDIELTKERQISKMLEEAVADVIRNSHDILAKKRCSAELSEVQKLRGEQNPTG